jgi:hypothetical protein
LLHLLPIALLLLPSPCFLKCSWIGNLALMVVSTIRILSCFRHTMFCLLLRFLIRHTPKTDTESGFIIMCGLFCVSYIKLIICS